MSGEKAPAGRPDLDPTRVMAECEVRFTRRSGPGGQNRNKVETAVVLHHRPTGLTAEASERRTQRANRCMALARLRMKLALERRVEVDGAHEPSALWRSRCRGGRVAISPEHEDFPAIAGEALDVIASAGYDMAEAGRRLGTSGSQVVKLLKLEPQALAKVNARRRERGLGSLK